MIARDPEILAEERFWAPLVGGASHRAGQRYSAALFRSADRAGWDRGGSADF